MGILKKTCLTLMLTLSAVSGVHAQESMVETFSRDLSSPVATPAKWVLLGGSLATLFVVATRSHIDTPFQNYMSSNKPLGRWAHLGDLGGQGYLNLAYFAGMLAASKIADSDVAQDRALLMLKSTAYSTVLTTTLKATVREPRPNNPNERNSWPSGHTTTAFAFASVVGAEHEWYWGLGAYSLATLTAMSRLNDDRHFLRDVVAGATIGASYGLGLYYRSHRMSDTANNSRQRFQYVATILPTDDLNGALLGLAASF